MRKETEKTRSVDWEVEGEGEEDIQSPAAPGCTGMPFQRRGMGQRFHTQEDQLDPVTKTRESSTDMATQSLSLCRELLVWDKAECRNLRKPTFWKGFRRLAAWKNGKPGVSWKIRHRIHLAMQETQVQSLLGKIPWPRAIKPACRNPWRL